MTKFVSPGTVSGRITAPGSKSIAQRAILAATLSADLTTLAGVTMCEDVIAALNVARALGASVSMNGATVAIRGFGGERARRASCGESGTCMRMAAPIAALMPDAFELIAEGTLTRRSMSSLAEAIQSLGAEAKLNGDVAPLVVRGPLRGGKVQLNGSQTSQVISGLLMALPCCSEDSELCVSSLASKPYVVLTIDLLRSFGVTVEANDDLSRLFIPGRQHYRGGELLIEGDWSAASCFLVAGAIAGDITVENLNVNSLQADTALLGVLERAGATVQQMSNAVRVTRAPLHAFSFDAHHCPDLFPALVTLACFATGTSTISGTARLRGKESDRAAALIAEFRAMGAAVEHHNDSFVIEGGLLRGGAVHSHNDHRIVMACSVAALGSQEGVSLADEAAVCKSYPEFFESLDAVRKNL